MSLMKQSENKVLLVEEEFKSEGLMSEEDTIIDNIACDYYNILKNSGFFYLTKERIIFKGGFHNLSIPYSDISNVRKCPLGVFIPYKLVAFLMPLGLRVTAKNPDTGLTQKFNFSIAQRNQWFNFIKEKTAC